MEPGFSHFRDSANQPAQPSADAESAVSVGRGRGRLGLGRWRVDDVGELSGFPGLRLFSRIRRGSLRESGVLADIVPTGTLEIRGS